ncbi:hypothetical protein [Petrachloros mirabilis]
MVDCDTKVGHGVCVVVGLEIFVGSTGVDVGVDVFGNVEGAGVAQPVEKSRIIKSNAFFIIESLQYEFGSAEDLSMDDYEVTSHCYQDWEKNMIATQMLWR